MNVRTVLNERELTHGNFKECSEIIIQLKDTLKCAKNYPLLDSPLAEALDMMCVKIGRIITGDPFFKDHWHDIIGYGTLALESIVGTQEDEERTFTSSCTKGIKGVLKNE